MAEATVTTAQLDRVEAQLYRIEAMLEEVLDRVPNGVLGRSRTPLVFRAMEIREREEGRDESLRKHKEAEVTWRRLAVPDRESLVLQVLGDDRLIIHELAERMTAELGYPRGADENGRKLPIAVYETHVRRLVTRMHRAGQIDRVEEPAPGCRIRYRYFRQQSLEGPIADLERTYQQAGE